APPLDESAWKMHCQRLLSPGPEQSAFLGLETQTNKVDDLYVNYRGMKSVQLPWPERKHDVSVLYVRLPTPCLEERGPEQVRALALELAEELPFNSGYVDFAVCASPWNFNEVLPLIHPRHPGIHLAPLSARLRMDTWVDGVHWMNFLGAPVLDQLGGITGLRQALPLPGISIEELGMDRVLILLGDHPDPGDPQTGRTLPRHRALARLLEPSLHHWPSSDIQVATGRLRRWEHRFLDAPESDPT
ncbi:MAG: type VI immunity family protein, partial [Cystobacter sp.]